MHYESRPLVKRIKQFCSPNGFDSFHLKWPIGKATNTSVRSKEFKAGAITLTSNGIQRALDQVWQFEVHWREAEESLIRLVYKGKLYLSDVYMARILLRNERTGCEQFGTSYLIVNKPSVTMPIMWNLPIDKSHQADDDYVLRCFLDTPNDFYTEFMEDSVLKYSHGLIALGVVDMFEEVASQTGESEDSTSDVVLITQQKGVERRFYCHRNILCMRSPVFKTMLGNKKFNEARDRVVQIDDIDTETMESVLKYIYTGDFRKLEKDAMGKLMNAAEKYDLPELIEQCGLHFLHLYDEDIDRLDLLQCAEVFRSDWIKRICLMALSTNMGVLQEEEFREGMSERSMEELNVIASKRAEQTKVVVVSSL